MQADYLKKISSVNLNSLLKNLLTMSVFTKQVFFVQMRVANINNRAFVVLYS